MTLRSSYRRPLLLATLVATTALAHAGGNIVPTSGRTIGNTQLYTPAGPGLNPAGGEIVSWPSATGGVNAPYRYYIEVFPGTTNLTVDIFDADVSSGEVAAGLDSASGDTEAVYRLFAPGAVLPTASLTGGAGVPVGANDAWFNLGTVASPAAGHWLVEMDMTAAVQTGGGNNDVNTFGLRAYETLPGTGDRELNLYYSSYTNYGVVAPGTQDIIRTFVDYPFITGGCSINVDNWDADEGGLGSDDNDVQMTSPGGTPAFNSAQLPMTPNDTWSRNTFAGWADLPGAVPSQLSGNYGVWRMTTRIDNVSSGTNFVPSRVSRFGTTAPLSPVNSTNPVGTANPRADTWRVYLPTDAGVAPVKPSMSQRVDGVDATVLTVGQPKLFYVTVEFVNPTLYPVTFSASNTLRANVPGGSVVYAGTPSINVGSIISEPIIGGSGNVEANPGIVPASSTVTMGYFITVTPPDALLVTVTGTEALNGTAATYVDETGNTTQAEATYTFGPLCPIGVRVGTPLDVTMGQIVATTNEDNTVTLAWETLGERDSAGFHVVAGGERLTSTLIPSAGTVSSGAVYTFVDKRPWLDDETQRAYFVEEIDLSGTTTLHGPAAATRRTGASAVAGWNQY